MRYIRLDPQDVDHTQLRMIGEAPCTQEAFFKRLFGEGEAFSPVETDWHVRLYDPETGEGHDLFVSFDADSWRYSLYAQDVKPVLLIEAHMQSVKRRKRRQRQAA